MSMTNKNVVCIRWGMKYGAHYVNRLYGMVARHLTPPFRFVCFTDSTLGLRDEIEVQPLPDLDVEMPLRTFGIWPKARLWGERLGDLSGPVLFLDLDVVVTGTLDGFFEYGDPDEVILARNPAVTFEALGQQFQAALSAALPGELLLGTAPACRLPGGDFSGQGITSPCH